MTFYAIWIHLFGIVGYTGMQSGWGSGIRGEGKTEEVNFGHGGVKFMGIFLLLIIIIQRFHFHVIHPHLIT